MSASTSAPCPDQILQTGLAFWASKALLSAVEMEVFTGLAKGPESLDSLTSRLGLHQRSARDFLDTLVALGFLERRNGEGDPSALRSRPERECCYFSGVDRRLRERSRRKAATVGPGQELHR